MSTISFPGPVAPYEDPAYGERPMYERRGSSSRTKEIVQQQDELMTDAYAPGFEYDGQVEMGDDNVPAERDGMNS